MRKHSLVRLVPIAACVLLALAACGGGGGSGDSPAVRTTDVPLSAQQSVGGLIDYIKQLIATGTNDASEPILVGDAVLPTDDTAEPSP